MEFFRILITYVVHANRLFYCGIFLNWILRSDYGRRCLNNRLFYYRLLRCQCVSVFVPINSKDYVFTITRANNRTLECICDAFGITLCQFFAEGNFIAPSDEQLVLLQRWARLKKEQRTVLLDLMDTMK